MNERELLALLRALSRIGGPLANAISPALGQGMGGVTGALGLAGGIAGGNIPAAIGGAAQLGSQVANLAGYSNIGGPLGSVAGPLALGTNLANGNVGGAVSAIPGTVSAGAQAAGSLGLIAPSTVSAITAPMTALAFPAMLLAVAAMSEQGGGQDVFDSIFGSVKSQAQKQVEEYQDYAQRFPGLVEDRARGASLLEPLQQFTPDQIGAALATATKGVRATDLAPAYDHFIQAPHEGKSILAAKIPGRDMSEWAKIAPELEGRNWASFVGLLDKAQQQGLDVNAIAGDRNRQMSNGQGHAFWTDPTTGLNVEADPNGKYSQSAYDLSNAIAGIGGQLGIDWGTRGNERAGENQGYTLYDDQLGQYGFAPGNQAAATLKYLSKLDPSVTQHQNWQTYKDALGVTDDMLNAIPDYSITPRNKPMNPLADPLIAGAFQVSDGGGG